MKNTKKALLFTYSMINRILIMLRFRLVYYPSGRNVVRMEYLEQVKVENIKKFFTTLKVSNHGHHLIRIGSSNDGGYLVPDELEGLKYCFSPGVSNNSNFEEQLALFGIQSYLADYSVLRPSSDNSSFHFTKKFLGSVNNSDTIKLDSWIESNESDNDMILQMDIEGDEYSVIMDTSIKTLKKFRILVVEFHNLDLLGIEKHFAIINSCLAKILDEFKIIHIHPNNCGGQVQTKDLIFPRVLEITFIRGDRFKPSETSAKLPHSLDRKNCTDTKNITLPSNII